MPGEVDDRYNTISAALRIIDPAGVLLPGTVAYNWATEMNLAWMAEMGADEAMRESEDSKRVPLFKRNAWQ